MSVFFWFLCATTWFGFWAWMLSEHPSILPPMVLMPLLVGGSFAFIVAVFYALDEEMDGALRSKLRPRRWPY